MKRRSDEEISAPLYAYDTAIRAEYGCFAGVDEAGRGPLRHAIFAFAQTARSTIIFLVSAIARAGERPLGQTFEQFMIVWQR